MVCAPTPHTSPSYFLQAISKKENNKLKEAKQFSIISFILVLIFAASYPILVVTVVLASVFGYMCDYVPKENAYYGHYGYTYYSRPYACGKTELYID